MKMIIVESNIHLGSCDLKLEPSKHRTVIAQRTFQDVNDKNRQLTLILLSYN